MSLKFLIAQLVFVMFLNMTCTILLMPPAVFPSLVALLLITIYIKSQYTAPQAAIKVTSQSKTETPKKSQNEKDLEMAAQVQQGLIALEPPTLPNVQIAKACHAAQNVGGDFYTFIYRDIQETVEEKETPGVIKYVDKRSAYLGIAIADVAGHGLSSALVMALSAGITREVAYQHRSPSSALEQVNTNLFHLIQDTHVPYVTMAYGVLQPDTLSFSYAKAGHCPILHQTRDGEIHELNSEGLFLGMYEEEVYEEKNCQLAVGDRLIFYTDGLTESRNPDGEFYGEDRFKTALKTHQLVTPEETHANIFKEVAEFTQNTPLSDDRTLVILAIT